MITLLAGSCCATAVLGNDVPASMILQNTKLTANTLITLLQLPSAAASTDAFASQQLQLAVLMLVAAAAPSAATAKSVFEPPTHPTTSAVRAYAPASHNP